MPLLNDSSLFVSASKSYENFCLVSFSFGFRNNFAVDGAGNYCVDICIRINF